MAKAEKFIIEGYSLRDLFKEEFLNKLEGLKEELFPVSVVFINEKKVDDKMQAYPLVFSHQNSEEVKKKKLHVESPNTDLVGSIVRLMEKK